MIEQFVEKSKKKCTNDTDTDMNTKPSDEMKSQ